MSLHFLDPENEPRECPKCSKLRTITTMSFAERRRYQAVADLCPECKGTGRLGVEGAEPDVETWEVTFAGGKRPHPRNGWYWCSPPGAYADPRCPSTPFPTEAAALEAARKARREGSR